MYDTKRMLAAALLALTMMPVTMTGCGGPTCGSGTVENDSGECVLAEEAVVCAEGTVLADGACVLDTTGCGTNTTLENGVCVPAETLCGDKTTFNTESGACEAAEECGTGTEANASGECVPAAGACAAGTTLNADGICEVATAACGAGTQLDAATGLCALTDTVCGDNTVLANGTCSIIADACTTGTIFNEGTGTCTPEAVCKPGDAISGGLCVTPAEALFAEATVEVPAGKTNPNDGGTAVELTLPAAGTSIIAKGTIEAPYDDDTDPDTPDIQDVDYLTFTGTKGQIVRLTIAPTPGSVAMLATVTLDSEDVDWERNTSPFGFGSARYMVLPEDGTYTITVRPNAPGFEPIGSDDYDYALELQEVALGAPALASAGITGELVNYSDNFFSLDQTAAGELVGLTFDELGTGADDVYVHIFLGDGAGNYTYDSTVEAAGDPSTAVFPAFSDDIAVLLGYGELIGTETAFNASLGAPTNLEDLGAIAADSTVDSVGVPLNNATQYYTFTLEANQVVEIQLQEDEVAELDVFGPDGVVFTGRELDGLLDNFFLDARRAVYFYSPSGGSYTMSARDESFALFDAVFSITSSTPGASTTLALGDSDQKDVSTGLDEYRRAYYTYEVSADSLLSIDAVGKGAGLTDIFVVDASTGEEIFTGDSYDDTSFEGNVPAEVLVTAGTYLVAVGAQEQEDLSSGFILDVSALTEPTTEAEPNETTADATTIDLEASYGLGQVTTGDVDVFTFQLANAIPAGSFARLTVTPDLAFDAATTYTCRLLDSDGTTVLAENTAVSTDCSLTTAALAVSTSYFLEVTTNSATAVDYRIDLDTYEGLLEAEPNNDSASATDLGTYVDGATVVAYGDLTTDGTNSDVDVHQLTFAADQTGKTLLLDVGSAYGEDSSAGVTVELFAAADLVTPVATQTGLGSTLEVVDAPAGVYYLFITRTDTDVITPARYRATATVAVKISASSAPDAAIVDDAVPGTSDVINITDTCTISQVNVPVGITHLFIGDLYATLTSPAGTTVVLHNNTGGSDDNIVGTYGDDLASAGSLSSFVGESATGDWTFYVEDNVSILGGNLDSWGLDLFCQ